MTIQTITPYFFYDGEAEAAIELYGKVLGARAEEVLRWGSMPQGCPEGADDQIMHALLHVGEAVLMLSDAPGNTAKAERNLSVAVQVDPPAEVDRLCGALAEAGGTLVDPPNDAFWGDRFGVVRDRFGVTWMFTSPLEGEKGA